MKPHISIVIPVHNEAGSVQELATEIGSAMGRTPWTWEAVWVNDRSSDGTVEILQALANQDAHHRVHALTGGKGQSAALVAGFTLAQGDVVATMDGDGQNDPADLPRLIDHLLKTKADMVNGRRYKRHDGTIRKIFSAGGNRVRNLVTGERLSDVGCALRVFHRRCVKDVSIWEEMRGMHRFMPTVARLNGCRRIEEVNVNHRPRSKGESKYSIRRRVPDFLADSLVIWSRLRTLPRGPRTWRLPSTDRRQAPPPFSLLA